jgi:hypothetical protein
MEALEAADLVGGGDKDDGVLAPTTGLIRRMASAFRRLKMPSASPISQQVASKKTPERFELMLQCGF